MKKLFTLAIALLGFAGVANAATVDDLEVLKHSYVLVCDDLGARPGKGVLFGANHFLDVTGGTTATNKGQVDLSVVDGNEGYVTQEIVDKYGADYAGPHYNWLRLKNAQDVIAMKLTAGTKLIIFEQGNNKVGKDARIPKIAKSADLSDALNAAPGEDHPATVAGFRWEYTVADDGLYYIGSYNGDMFVSFIIVEAKEAPGTPTVKLGEQTYEGGLWFREVTCKANPAVEGGESLPTVVTYTTDGTAPTAKSPLYTAPIKCYQDMTVKFQAFYDFDENGKLDADDEIADGADNEANVSFSFDAPAIEAEGANVTIVSPYENARNFLSLDGTESGAEELGQVTLDESATIYAYTLIENGDYGTFKSKSSTKDVYVLNPIKEKKTIAVTSADVILDEEATATSTTGEVYKVENGEISADKKDFFVKGLEFAVVKDANYQIDGKEAYIKMNNTKISFFVAEGDSVNVKVVCSKNACKNIDAADAEDGSAVNDRKCFVNVSGTNYGHMDAEGNEAADQKLFEDANVIEFGLKGAEGGSIFTFQKYSGTGNILISSIEITPAAAEAATVDIMDKFVNNWNGEESNTHNADGTITYNAKQWGGLAAWLVVDDVPADWSEYSQIVFEFAEPTPFATQPYIQYNDGTETKAWVEAGATKAVCDLEAGKNAVKQVALQAADNGTLTVTKIYLVKGGDTAVKTIKTVKAQNGAIYNLAGQKVSADYKGVVIINGKKVLNK